MVKGRGHDDEEGGRGSLLMMVKDRGHDGEGKGLVKDRDHDDEEGGAHCDGEG